MSKYFVHQIPERARQRIIDIASTQFADGGCYHQYQPLTKRGNNDIGGGFNDDPCWLIFGTVAYIKETGDFSILDEQVPFDNVPGSGVSLLEHLRVSFDHVVNNLGPHGLPLIGRADWNDCLNLNCFSWDPNESFQTTENKSEGSKAESLMIAGLFVVTGNDYVELCRRIGHEDEAARAQRAVDNMVEAVKQHGWDGEWFLRVYDFYGNKIGSDENEEGKIFIESQGWCTMAGIGLDEGLCDKALDAVKERLDSEHGIVLNNPAYTTYHVEMGEISSYPEGYKENAGLFVVTGNDYVELCRRIGHEDEAARAQRAVDNMVEAVKQHGWDGEWFLRVYDFYGNKIGSDENEEGKIFIESQGWCTMAGIGLDEGLCDKALDAVKERLDSEHGIVLNNPAYTTYHVEMGEISSYPEGYKENAGIFCHNNPWVIIGETVAGRGDDAWQHYTKILPSYVEEKYQTLHKVEPYVNCQMVAGKDAARPGEGKNSWLTGTAAWMWYTVSEFLLGVKPDYEGLRIAPCLPSEARDYRVHRVFRGAEYDIHVSNPNGRSKGVQQITVDGKTVEGQVIPATPGRHTVEVVM